MVNRRYHPLRSICTGRKFNLCEKGRPRRMIVLIEHVIIFMLITFIIGLFTGVSLARPRM